MPNVQLRITCFHYEFQLNGTVVLALDNNKLQTRWNDRNFTSNVGVTDQTWSRVAITWRESDGLMYLYRLEQGGANQLELDWGSPFGINLTIASISVGGFAPGPIKVGQNYCFGKG